MSIGNSVEASGSAIGHVPFRRLFRPILPFEIVLLIDIVFSVIKPIVDVFYKKCSERSHVNDITLNIFKKIN